MNIEKENKYPRGYWPKIEYWLETLEASTQKVGDRRDYSVEHCIEKLKYFTKKQQEVDAVTAKF